MGSSPTQSIMFEPGDVIVVTMPSKDHPKRDVGFVYVQENFGPIPGYGWLLLTTQRNLILASQVDDFADAIAAGRTLQSCMFVTNKAHAAALMWLVNHPERINDLAGFIQYCKQSNAVNAHFKHISGFID